MDASTFFSGGPPPPPPEKKPYGQQQQQDQPSRSQGRFFGQAHPDDSLQHRPSQPPVAHSWHPRQYHGQTTRPPVRPVINPTFVNQQLQKQGQQQQQHLRSSSMGSVRSTDEFETLDIDANAGTTDHAANDTSFTASNANEDFRNYGIHPNPSHDDSHEEQIPGVALQTALSAFGHLGNVASSLGSNVAGNVRSNMNIGIGNVMSSVSPAKLAGNMASWRGRLADVVAPVERPRPPPPHPATAPSKTLPPPHPLQINQKFPQPMQATTATEVFSASSVPTTTSPADPCSCFCHRLPRRVGGMDCVKPSATAAAVRSPAARTKSAAARAKRLVFHGLHARCSRRYYCPR